jgi:hypothetical protein
MLFSVAAVLLICPVAFGGLMDLYQDFAIGSADFIQRVGPDSSADLHRTVEIDQDQRDTAPDTVFDQEQTGELVGNADTDGVGGRSTVTQVADAAGVQVGTLGSALISQQGALVLGNDLLKECGDSEAHGDQTWDGEQDQKVTTNPGDTENEQDIYATQNANIEGDDCSNAAATQGLAVSANQINANDPCPDDCCPGCELQPSFTLDQFLAALE